MTLDTELRQLDNERIQESAKQVLASRGTLNDALGRFQRLTDNYPALGAMQDQLLEGVEGWTPEQRLAAEMAIGYVVLTLSDYAEQEHSVSTN